MKKTSVEKLIECRMIRRAAQHKRASLRAVPVSQPRNKERDRYKELAQEYLRLCSAFDMRKDYRKANHILNAICLREFGYYMQCQHKDFILAEAAHLRNAGD